MACRIKWYIVVHELYLQMTIAIGWEDVQDRSAPADCPPQLFDATDDDICVVCFDSQIDTAMLPCGHIAVCFRYALRRVATATLA